MWPDYPEDEVKTFDEWCTLVWDLFVFKEGFLKYLQDLEGQGQMHGELPMQFWAFKLAWANYQHDVIMPRLRFMETEDD